ncbi:MAG: filamentous hemagglutinin N-terminal domain-containing protein [Planctomycetales bacterium]|nr:filamentous hemagglutinin N-terminal domain-containing protein [Planctomycetales bacterium]
MANRNTAKTNQIPKTRLLLQSCTRKQMAGLLALSSLAITVHVVVAQDAGLPTGGNVVAGTASLNSTGGLLNVNASTARSIVNWNSFNVGAGKAVNFNLPNSNSAILNRVVTPNMSSTVNGVLNSNGHVYLVNPSGIVLGSQGVVNTNGFVASTFDIANDDFMKGGPLPFRNNGSDAAIVNNGTINTGKGGAHLVANQITNNGVIQSNGGNVTLSAGGIVTLDNGVTYVQPSLETLASGISPTASLIQNTGTIRATGAATVGGEVYLVNPNGEILHDGTIAVQDAHVDGTTGGKVQLEADEITLTKNSSIDATGSRGGGEVLVGGNWQGGGSITQATTVTMESGAVIDASATNTGDGGKIVLWSDVTKLESITKAFGTLVAKAGEMLGDGGKIETSGHRVDTNGISVDASASNGEGGHWLIDPYNYLIDAVAAGNIVSALNSGTSVEVATTANNTSYGSSGNSSDNGDITVTGDIITGAMAGDATLTLKAARHIRLDAATGIDATQNGNTAKLNVKLWADTDNSGDGINAITSAGIKTNGGSLTFGNGDTANIGGSTVKVGGDLYINGSSAQTLQTAGGNITINGETIVANSVGGVTFDSGGGNIVFEGLLNSGNSYAGINATLDWSAALSAAASGSGDQVGDTYLATVTSRLENAIAGMAVNYQQSWLGGRRVVGIGTDSAWRWVTGPEGLQDGGNGLIYSYQSASGGASSANGLFNNWSTGEPNNWNGSGIAPLNTESESVQQFTGTAGLWNDLPRTGANLEWYVRETNLAPTAVTINAGTGTLTASGIGGGKALASLDVMSNGVTVNGNSLITTGAQNYDSALTVSSTIGLTVDGTTLTSGGALNFSATNNIDVDASLVVPGAITIDGGDIVIDGNVTSSDTGDIYVQSNSATDNSIRINGDVFKTGGDRSTITLRADGRVRIGNVTASGGTELDTVLWSDYHNTGSGGTGFFGHINTGGGHLWMGGSSTDGGSETWNGLTVGDGASDGANGFNHNALDFYGDVTTNGGDVLVWGGDGYNLGIDGIGINANHFINAGSGNITLIANDIDGAVLTIDSTGVFTFKPHDNAWTTIGLQFDFDGTIASDTFTGSIDADWLKINNYSLLGGLTIGKDGITSGIRAYDPISISGDLNLIGGNIIVDNAIDTSDVTGGDILLKGAGDVVLSDGASLTTNAGDAILWADSDNSGDGGVQIVQNNLIDTRTSADRTAMTHTTGGGNIVIAGGLDDGGVSSGIGLGAAGDGTPDGYAVNATTYAGVLFGLDNNTTQDINVDLFSGGGDIIINGKSSYASAGYAIQTYQGYAFDAGEDGDITMHGYSDSTGVSSVGFDLGSFRGETGGHSVIRTKNGNILLDGYARNGASESIGIAIDGGTTKRISIEATGTGSVTLRGDAAGTGASALRLGGLDVLAASGDIQLLSDSGRIWSIDIISGAGVNIGQKAGSSVTTSTSDVLIKTPDSIHFGTVVDITTDGGNAIAWASTDGGNVDGYVYLADGSSITTGGGHVWLGGSTSKATPGTLVGDGTTTWNGLTVGNGYAVSGSGVTVPNGPDWRAGIGLANANIATGGGDFYAAGMDLNTVGGGAGGGSGIVHGGTNGSINAGSGSIEMNAYSGASGAYAMLIGVHPNGVDNSLTLSSSSNDTTAIALAAETASTDANFMGLLIEDDLKINATGSGGISLTGRSAADIGIRVGSVVDSGNLEVLAAAGTITIDTGDDDLAFYNASSLSYLGAKAGSPVTSSTSDIVIIADSIPNNSANMNIDTTGALSFQPFSAAGSGTSANTTGWNFGTTLSGLTIGTDTTPYDTVTFGSAATINAPVSIYGGNVTINAGLTSTGTSIVTLDASGAITDGASGFVVSDQLAILGGSVTLDSAGNNVQTLAASGVSSLYYTDSDTLTIGTVNPTGISSTGPVTLEVKAGTLSITENVSTTDTTANAITLIADDLELSADLTAPGGLSIKPYTAGTSVGVVDGIGTLQITSADLGHMTDGFSSISIGGFSAGQLKVGGLTSLTDNLILQAGSAANLQVTGPISWSSDDALTLVAGQNIWILNDIDVNGSTAGLNLLYGGTNGTTAPTAGTNLYIDLDGRRTIDFADKAASLKIGNEAYTLIDSVAEFTGMTPSGKYALANGLDLSGTTYDTAVYNGTFTGKVDGLGHSADGMIIQNSTGGNLGLFAELNGSTVRHLGVTNFNIKTNSSADGVSGNEYRVGGLAGNIGGAGTPVSTVTSLDGVWSSGVISTEQGSKQKFFFGGGLVGSQNGGFMNIMRSYSTANVSTDGSSSNNLATGGLVGDIGINTNLPTPHTTTTSATVDYAISKSYATGSIVQGDYGFYFGSGGLVGVIFTSGGELTDSYSWSNVVGSGSFGGIAGYALSGTYERNYTTQASVGAGSVATASSYNGTTLPTATNNGTQLPSGWSSAVWSVADRPTLNALPVPPRPLYVKVGTGTSSVYGDSLGIGYTIVDESGAAVTFGSGAYTNLTGTSGTGVYTVADGAHAANYSSVSYLSGLGLTGGDADDFILNPFSSSGSHNVTARPLTVSLATSGVTKVYDGTIAAPGGLTPTYSFSNFITGDTGATVNHVSALYNDADVLDATTLTVSGLSIASITGTNGSLASDYSLSASTLNTSASITPKSLSVSGITANNKAYDGTAAATLNGGAAVFTGIVSGDDVSIDTLSGNFADKYVGTGKAVTFAATFTGAHAANYSISSQSMATADITPATLTVTGVTADNKVYDGTVAATLSGSATVAPVAGDSVSLVGDPIATFADKNAANGKAVSVIGYSLTGNDALNYSISQPAGLSADITKAPLLVTANSDAKFVTKSDPVGYAGVFYDGFVAGEGLGELGGTLSITRTGTDELAGSYAGVLVPSGITAANYAVSFANGDFTIVPAEELIVRFNNTDSTFGTPAALNFASAEYMDSSNVVHTLAAPTVVGNTYTLNDGAGGTAEFTAAFGSPNFSTGGTLQVGSYDIVATNINETSVNFSNSLTVVGNHTVDTKPVTLNLTGVGKTYDGTIAMGNLIIGLNGTVAGDDLGASGFGIYSTRNVGTGLSYTLGDLDLTGADAGNYFLSTGSSWSGTNGTITPKPVTLTAPAVTKVYDGNTTATVTQSHLDGLTAMLGVAGDLVQSIVLTYDDKNVGTSKSLTPSSAVILDGNGGANYAITFADNTSSSIDRLGSVMWIGGTTGNWSNPANWAEGAIPDLANVANVVIPNGVTPLFDNSVPGPVAVDSYTGGNFLMDSGVLSITNNMSVHGFTQNSGQLTVGGSLNVNSPTNPISQGLTGTLIVHGTTTLSTNGDITLNSPTNDFQGPISLTGNNVDIRDGFGDLILGDVMTTGNLCLTADGGSILQTDDSEVIVGGDTKLVALRDVLLDNEGNIFGGIVDVCAENAEIFQSVGDLVLRTVKVGNDFWAKSKDGGIKQTSGGTVTVGGKTTLIARKAISLPGNNSFGGQVFVDGLPYDFGDNDVELVEQGLARSDDLMRTASSDAIFDTFLRPQKTAATPTGGDAGLIYDRITNWWQRVADTFGLQTNTNVLTIKHVDLSDDEVHIIRD